MTPTRGKSQNYPMIATAGAVVVDGLGHSDRVHTLFVGSEPTGGNVNLNLEAAVPTPGAIGFQFSGLHGEGPPYIRRFTLGLGCQVTLDMTPFLDCRLTVVYVATPLDAVWKAVAIAEYEPVLNAGARDELVYGDFRATPAIYTVPPGAYELVAGIADAGFHWGCPAYSGIITIPDPLAAGDVVTVKGTHFQTTVANWRGVWRLRL